MKKTCLLLLFIVSLSYGWGQQNHYWAVAMTNQETAYPFGKFGGLFTGIMHPGIEGGLGKDLSSNNKKSWILEYRAGYFFHRFVQHAIYATVHLGYKYQLKRFDLEGSLGGGWLQSIPATGKFKLNSEGEYVSNKGIGRLQATANFDLGIAYKLKKADASATRIFMRYGQRLQLPFIKSYVPLLPYNSISLGLAQRFKSKK